MTEGKDIYIVLTSTGTWFSKLIRIFTNAPYNHASIAFDSELREVYTFGRKRLNNPFEAGLIKENFEDSFYDGMELAVYRCRVSRLEYNMIYDRLTWMMDHSYRYKFNFLGMIGVLLNKKINRKNAFFCSQFVAFLFQQAGIPLINKPPELVTPWDFSASPFLQEVYTGTVFSHSDGANPEYLTVRKAAG
ncbi:C40 family peptidase [Paenibacillus alkalitolerans]|uniref:hypothetical protein n=1 Tax=Paenibacillus alkalitolerans TaxID=2799335 RepID=UPI0018F5A27D|nr:hypothetical protein [Paenibacillus alkalitolerans]